MHLLQSGVDISVIALRLGHESPATTHHYVDADLAMKERARPPSGTRHEDATLPRSGLAAGVSEDPVIRQSSRAWPSQVNTLAGTLAATLPCIIEDSA